MSRQVYASPSLVRVVQHCYLYFDSAASKHGKVAGIVLKSPLGHIFKFAYWLEFKVTNNVAKYEALLLDTELAISLKVKLISIKGDLDLVIMQINKYKQTNKENKKNHM